MIRSVIGEFLFLRVLFLTLFCLPRYFTEMRAVLSSKGIATAHAFGVSFAASFLFTALFIRDISELFSHQSDQSILILNFL